MDLRHADTKVRFVLCIELRWHCLPIEHPVHATIQPEQKEITIARVHTVVITDVL